MSDPVFSAGPDQFLETFCFLKYLLYFKNINRILTQDSYVTSALLSKILVNQQGQLQRKSP